jgi:hypothetical protein
VVTVSGISGIVTDPTGAVIPGAAVSVKNQAAGGNWDATTDGSGSYSFPVLLPGTYTVTVSHPGFRSAVVSDQHILAGQPAHVDVSLQIGDTSQTVTVSAKGSDLITTSTAEIAADVAPALVKNIPLSRRNFFDLTTLTPNVVPQTVAYGASLGASQAYFTMNNMVVAGTIMNSGVFVGGNRDSASNIAIDGGNVQSVLYGESFHQQSPASVQELRVETANMSAEFGNGVSAVNVITKSGTNQYHGELYDYLRNNKLDAADFFTNLATQKLPNYRQNQFGVAVGGPIKKDKVLFFANYEGLRVSQTSVSQEQVPPTDIRLGDFSNYRLPVSGEPGTFGPVQAIYNPYRFDPNTGLREPFPDNKIPLGPTTLCSPRPTCIDPAVAAYLQKYVLQPNAVIDGLPMLVGNTTTTMGGDQFNFRVDWLKSAKTTIYGRYTRIPLNEQQTGLMPLEGQSEPLQSQNAVLHWTQTLKPTAINELMVSFSRPVYAWGRKSDVPDVAKEIGIVNTSTMTGSPFFEQTGFALGTSSAVTLKGTTNTYELKDDLSTIRGRHSIKAGIEVNEKRMYFPVNANDKGQFIFGNNWSRACPQGNTVCDAAAGAAGLDQGGLAFSDFLLGSFANDLVNIASAFRTGYQRYYGGYVQDSWRVTPKLTLNYGLRYEYWSPYLVPRNYTLSFDFNTAQIIYALANPLDYLDPAKCYGQCAPLNPHSVSRSSYTRGEKNFAPRLGLGYQLRPTTTVRASLGMYFDGNINNNQLGDAQIGGAPFTLRREQVFDISQQVPTGWVSTSFPPATPTTIPKPNDTPLDTFRFAMPHYKIATVYQWSASIQQRLGANFSLELNYLGSHTIREFQFEDMNAPDLPQGPLANVPLDERRRYPQWGVLSTWNPIGWAKYNAFIANVKNNEWHGLTLISNYTWAKNMVSSHWGFSDIGSQNYRYPYAFAGPYMSTPYHRFVAGYSYQLPFGRQKALASSLSPLPEKLVSGWSVSGVTTLSMGSPQLVLGNDLTGTGAYAGVPDAICNPNKNAPRTRFEWFRTECLPDAPYGRLGDSTIGSVTLPGTNNWDLAISKFTRTNFPKESGQVEFRVDLFNAFNHTQWGSPVTFGPANLGVIYSTRPPRQIQLALRYLF